MEGFWVHYLLVLVFHLLLMQLKKMTGMGAPRLGSELIKGHGTPRLGMYQPPPFIGTCTWEQVRKGGSKKKNKQKSQEKDYC